VVPIEILRDLLDRLPGVRGIDLVEAATKADSRAPCA
jgi:hypothetical protein